MRTMPQEWIVCGVDTHAEVHTAAVVDGNGQVLGVTNFDATNVGYRQLVDWLAGFGPVLLAGVEGTSSYGKGLASYLRSHCVEIREVIRPNRQARRRNGKSDPADAIAAARAVLSGEASAIPKTGDGPVEAIRALRIARSSAVKARTQAANQIRDLIRTAPDDLRDVLNPLTTRQRVEACSRLRTSDKQTVASRATRTALRLLARRHLALTTEIDELTRQLEQLVTTTAPTLCSLKGVGPDVAAKLLVTAGDNYNRIRNEAAFAALCGASPLDASSGKQQRHRLNRGGDRQANNALWRIAIVRMSSDPTTRHYVERRTKEGLTKGEIIRCLKRYIARETHHAITKDLAHLT
jgi:transposase